MELKNRFTFRDIFLFLYIFAFLIYLMVGFLPAEAKNLANLKIPSINLEANVIESILKDGELSVPNFEVGGFSHNKNKMLLFGHSSTVFYKLHDVRLGDKIIYDGKVYKIFSREISLKESIHMNKLLRREEEDTIVIMTCAGKGLENNDATHRLILTAKVE